MAVGSLGEELAERGADLVQAVISDPGWGRVHQVVLAHEASHEAGLGSGEHFGRRPDLLQPASVQNKYPVGHRYGFALVVSHVNEAAGQLLLQSLELHLHLDAERGVKRPQGLVQENDPGLGGNGPGQRDALLLTPAELLGTATAESLQAD